MMGSVSSTLNVETVLRVRPEFLRSLCQQTKECSGRALFLRLATQKFVVIVPPIWKP